MPTPAPESNDTLPAPTPPWKYAALGLGGAALVGGVIFLATRDAKASPKRLEPGRTPGQIPGQTGPVQRDPRLPRGRLPRRPTSAPPKQSGGRPRTRPGRKQPRVIEDPPPPPSGGRTGRSGRSGRKRPKRRSDVPSRRRRQPRQPRHNPQPEPSVDPPPPKANKKDKIAGGTERRNSALTLVLQPTSHSRGVQRGENQALADWLADVAYWNTYPDAPTKIDPNNAGHKRYVKAWLRIRQYIGKGLTLLPNLGKHPVRPEAPQAAHDNWHRWALAVSFSSPLRTAGQLRSGFKKAWHYVLLDPNGIKWQHQHLTKRVGGLMVDIDGLLAEAAVWHSAVSYPEAHRTLQRWPETLTKAFASANNIMTKT